MSDYLPIENGGIRNYQMSGAKKITSERSSRVIFRPTNAIISFPHFHEGHNSIIHALKNPLKVDNGSFQLDFAQSEKINRLLDQNALDFFT